MLFKRTIILCNKNEKNNNAIAFVNIQKDAKKMQATLKCYNLQNFDELNFGLCEDDKEIIKTRFNPKNNESVFDIHTNFNMDGNLGCVIVGESEKGVEPLLWGKNDCLDILFPSDKNHERDNKGRFAGKKKEELFEEPSDKELEEMITAEISEDEQSLVSANSYKKDKEEQKISSEQFADNDDEEPKHKLIPESEDGTFYSLICDQIEDLFAKYPEEERLQELIPHSKWAKVDYDNKGKDYAVGLIYDGDVLKYLAYGIPASKTAEVQEEIREYSQWIPLDPTSVDSKGFWVMYQDAVTGDSVNISADDRDFA